VADLKEKSISLLSSSVLQSLNSAATATLYTVPAGKTAVITNICIHTPSASLSSVTSVAFGNNSATYNNWDTGRTVALVTGTTLCINLYPTLPDDSATQVTTICAENTTFKYLVTTGSAVTATIDVFGYIY
jgi:hypothetical protein